MEVSIGLNSQHFSVTFRLNTGQYKQGHIENFQRWEELQDRNFALLQKDLLHKSQRNGNFSCKCYCKNAAVVVSR